MIFGYFQAKLYLGKLLSQYVSQFREYIFQCNDFVLVDINNKLQRFYFFLLLKNLYNFIIYFFRNIYFVFRFMYLFCMVFYFLFIKVLQYLVSLRFSVNTYICYLVKISKVYFVFKYCIMMKICGGINMGVMVFFWSIFFMFFRFIGYEYMLIQKGLSRFVK